MKDIDLNEIFKKITFEDNKEKDLIAERIISEEYSFFYGQSKEKANRKTWLGLAMIQATLYNTLNQFNIKVDSEEKAKKVVNLMINGAKYYEYALGYREHLDISLIQISPNGEITQANLKDIKNPFESGIVDDFLQI